MKIKLSQLVPKERSCIIPNTTLTRHGAPLLFAFHANTFYTRLVGLIGKAELGINEALLIQPCRSIHTIGMRFIVDVIFLDQNGIMVKILPLKPHRFALCLRAHSVLELRHGTAHRLKFRVGQKLVRLKMTNDFVS